LLAIYSPMLVAAEQELLTAVHLARSVDSTDHAAAINAQVLVSAARRRLAYWDISADQIARLEQTGEITKSLTLAAPVTGVVLDKAVVEGQAVEAGMKLYRLANLSSVWLEGDVFEQDLSAVHNGAPARVEFASYPGRSWVGHVTFVSPIVDSMSRTATVRVSLDNAGGLLKPGMYGTMYFTASLDAGVPHVPAEAVVMTGERNLVYVVRSDGALQPREVILGPRAGDQIQILSGVHPGDRIVASANFLVDAESRLATDGSDMAGMPGMEAPASKAHP
jgi:Cu(I)/Ag(I) efflux system membrane fusion protein